VLGERMGDRATDDMRDRDARALLSANIVDEADDGRRVDVYFAVDLRIPWITPDRGRDLSPSTHPE
jgi:hypothetical protein